MRQESIKAKLVALSGRLDRDFNALAVEFAIERLVTRLQADVVLSKHLVFKGGFVLLKAYGSNRATIDLDASIQKISIEDAESKAKAVITQEWQDGLWMGSIVVEDLRHQTEYAGRRLTIRFSFGKPKAEASRLGKLILDIGVADKITPGPVNSEMQTLLGEEPVSWKIYPVETIVAEKLHALVAHGSQNSRVKDIYDLVVLLPKCENLTILMHAIDRTFQHRSTEVPLSFRDYWRNLDKTILRRSSGAVYAATGSIPKFGELDKQLKALLTGLEKG